MADQTIPAKDWLSGFLFLEGPRWRGGKLWLSDITAETVLAIDEKGNRDTVATVPGLPSGLGFLPNGAPLVASMNDRKILRITDGGTETHADLTQFAEAEVNDMVVDPGGNAFVGAYDFHLFAGETPKPGKILFVSNDGQARIVAEDLAYPNGMVLVNGGSTLVVAETFTHRLTSFDIGPDGSLTNRRVFAQLSDVLPDGICLDAEGAIWVSSFAQGAFLRVHESGEISSRVDFPGRHAVACQLGGSDGKTLYCLTTEGTLEDIANCKSKSFVSVASVNVPGAGSP